LIPEEVRDLILQGEGQRLELKRSLSSEAHQGQRFRQADLYISRPLNGLTHSCTAPAAS